MVDWNPSMDSRELHRPAGHLKRWNPVLRRKNKLCRSTSKLKGTLKQIEATTTMFIFTSFHMQATQEYL